jgi:hypothetical protein
LLTVPAPREIDLSGVTEIDTSGVQLLMLAKRSAQAQQLGLRLSAPSAAVTALFELLDLVAYFGDPPRAPSPACSAATPAALPRSREVTP